MMQRLKPRTSHNECWRGRKGMHFKGMIMPIISDLFNIRNLILQGEGVAAFECYARDCIQEVEKARRISIGQKLFNFI